VKEARRRVVFGMVVSRATVVKAVCSAQLLRKVVFGMFVSRATVVKAVCGAQLFTWCNLALQWRLPRLCLSASCCARFCCWRWRWPAVCTPASAW